MALMCSKGSFGNIFILHQVIHQQQELGTYL